MVLARLGPRRVENPVDVVARHRVVGSHRIEARQLVQLFVEGLADVRRQVFGGGFGTQLGQVFAAVVLAQFVLNGLHLLAKQELALLLVHVGAHLRADFLAQLEHLDFLLEVVEHEVGALAEARRSEDGLLLVGARLQVRGDKVDEERRAFDVLDGEGGLARQVRREMHDLDGQLLQHRHAGAALRVVLVERRLVERGHLGAQVGLRLDVFLYLKPTAALDDDGLRAVGHLDELQDGGERAGGVQVFRPRLLGVGVFLRHHADQLVGGERVFDELEAGVAPDSNREDDAREEDGVAERQDGQRLRQVGAAHRLFFVGGGQRNGLVGKLVGEADRIVGIGKHSVGDQGRTPSRQGHGGGGVSGRVRQNRAKPGLLSKWHMPGASCALPCAQSSACARVSPPSAFADATAPSARTRLVGLRQAERAGPSADAQAVVRQPGGVHRADPPVPVRRRVRKPPVGAGPRRTAAGTGHRQLRGCCKVRGLYPSPRVMSYLDILL